MAGRVDFGRCASGRGSGTLLSLAPLEKVKEVTLCRHLLPQGGEAGLRAWVAAGLLLLLGHIVNLGGDPEYGTVLGETLVLGAHALLVFALVSLWAIQAERSGPLGAVGMVLSVVGTTLNCAAVLAEIAGASGAEVDAVVSEGASGTITLLGGLAFLIGLILFGIATMRAGVLPRWAGPLLILGDVVFAVGTFAGSAALIVEVVGALITCAAFVWLGLALLSTGDGQLQRTARVS